MEWFIGLPLAAQIIFGLLSFAAIIAVAYIGRLTIVMGGPKISFGRVGRRNCGDCILLLMSKRERYELARDRTENHVLKEQMNLAEQKLLSVQSILLSSYREKLRVNRENNPNYNEENKQYRLYQGILGNALMSVKDEIRRSFKENGFVHLSGSEFSNYVKEKTKSLTSIGRDHVIDLYPYADMIVTIDDRLDNLDQIAPKLEDICFELFQGAKQIHKESMDALVRLNNEFSAEIDELVERKS